MSRSPSLRRSSVPFRSIIALAVAGALTACGGGPKPNPVTPIAVLPVAGPIAAAPAGAPAPAAAPAPATSAAP